MLIYVLAVASGLVLLVWGADRFVAGSAGTARNLGVSPLLIGLTLVGFGTSAPEILVSAIAAWQGNPGLSIGNALGSNIINIAMVLGVTALVVPLTIQSSLIRQKMPVLIGIMAADLLLMLDGELSRLDGILMLAGMFGMVFWLVQLGLRSRGTDPLVAEFDAEIPDDMSLTAAVVWAIVGLVVLLVSAQLLVWGAVNMAQYFGVPDLVIGLSIVAIGTSLPELAASMVGALKGEHDIAVGNVIGSNMFNLLAVMGLAGALGPGPFEPDVLTRDYPVMLGLTLLLFAMGYEFKGHGRINRLEGAALLGAFFGYMAVLYSGMLN